MPHLHIKEFKEPQLPISVDGSTFHFIATNDLDSQQKLICTTIDDENFFLLYKEDGGRKLLKTDKLSRPSKNHVSKKALLDYASISGCEVISSNVNNSQKNMHLQDDSSLKSIEYFAQHFPQDKQICIEVGFGSGRHLIHQALNNPQYLYIGIEIHKPSIEQVLKQISIQKIENILLLNYDARLFMELVPSNLAHRVYVHFPVPWDKKPHRRVISKAFVQESIRVLKKGGKLELRTDSDNYFNYSFETYMSLGRVFVEVYKNRDISITSKYEDRWRRMEKNIYDLHLNVEEESSQIDINDDFSFSKELKTLDELKRLKDRVERFDDGFIHFDRFFHINSTKVMFRVAMGSFDRPEHLYIILDENSASYFPHAPVKTRTNLKIHKFLNGLLHE